MSQIHRLACTLVALAGLASLTPALAAPVTPLEGHWRAQNVHGKFAFEFKGNTYKLERDGRVIQNGTFTIGKDSLTFNHANRTEEVACMHTGESLHLGELTFERKRAPDDSLNAMFSAPSQAREPAANAPARNMALEDLITGDWIGEHEGKPVHVTFSYGVYDIRVESVGLFETGTYRQGGAGRLDLTVRIGKRAGKTGQLNLSLTDDALVCELPEFNLHLKVRPDAERRNMLKSDG